MARPAPEDCVRCLVLAAADWLIDHNVLLPGVSTLERVSLRIV